MTGPRAYGASAPGKVILLGEHAVVHGQPCLSVALDRRIRVAVRDAPDLRINGEAPDPHRHSYILQGLRRLASGRTFHMETTSDLPSASGLGSSAALSVALTGALRRREGMPLSPADAARDAFAIERTTQGAASPNDTTVAAAGGALLLSGFKEDVGTPLWTVESDDRRWSARRLEYAPPPLVVANTGGRARTGEMVAKVRHTMETQPAARGAFEEIGQLAREGARRFVARDWSGLGTLFEENARWLRRLGLETPALEKALAAVRAAPGTLGAKLTGAGGGGCLIALTDRPEAAREALVRAGALWVPALPSARGLEADG